MKPIAAMTGVVFLLLVWSQELLARSIQITNLNGKVNVTIDGQRIDLNKAHLINETNEEKVFEAVEIPGVKITENKLNGKLSIDYDGYHYETLQGHEIDNLVNQQVQSVHQQLQNMQGFFQRLFSRFPFF